MRFTPGTIRTEKQEVAITSDGKTFTQKEEAVEHQFVLNLTRLCSDAGYSDAREAAYQIISDNRKALFLLLSACDLDRK